MEAHLIEMLGMLLRWLHVIAGIAWIAKACWTPPMDIASSSSLLSLWM